MAEIKQGYHGRGGCAFHGALWTVSSIRNLTAVVHSNAGCSAQGHLAARGAGIGFPELFQTPTTSSIDRHVVFGGGSRLREQIKNTVKIIDSKLYVVLQGCESAMVGDDVTGITREALEATHPVLCSLVAGLHGGSRFGYAKVLSDLLGSVGELKGLAGFEPDIGQESSVNVFGVVPVTDPHFRGDLFEILRILNGLGLSANIFFGASDGVEELSNAKQAKLSLVFSKWGRQPAEKLLESADQAVLERSCLPVGFEAVKALKDAIAEKLGECSLGAGAQSFLESERVRQERLLEPLDEWLGEIVGAPVALVGDESAITGLAKFLRDRLGAEISLAVITDASDAGDMWDRSEICDQAETYEQAETIEGAFVCAAQESGVKKFEADGGAGNRNDETIDQLAARVHRCGDGAEISEILTKARPLVVLGGAPDEAVAKKLGAGYLNVSFPSSEIVLGRSFVGLHGAVALAEKYASEVFKALDFKEASAALKLVGS
ncbi:MAG: hypothetical protein LBT62_08290 [Deltaproteobacteria bacterium]|jgi:nitrogenase molybdenum-iron protein beta chain|nr:hypothetical protein [Deltaproteobacteria bacterium]